MTAPAPRKLTIRKQRGPEALRWVAEGDGFSAASWSPAAAVAKWRSMRSFAANLMAPDRRPS